MTIGLILILILLILLPAFIVFKWDNFSTKTIYILVALVVGFLIISWFVVFSGKDVDLRTMEGVFSAAKMYFSWLGNTGSNIIGITSYVFSQDWKGEKIINNTGIE